MFINIIMCWCYDFTSVTLHDVAFWVLSDITTWLQDRNLLEDISRQPSIHKMLREHVTNHFRNMETQKIRFQFFVIHLTGYEYGSVQVIFFVTLDNGCHGNGKNITFNVSKTQFPRFGEPCAALFWGTWVILMSPTWYTFVSLKKFQTRLGFINLIYP